MRSGGCFFFAVAATAGERAPSETTKRYSFLRVRRVGALVLGARKSLILDGFPIPLENNGENEAFWAFARWSLPLFHWKCECLSFLSVSFPSLLSFRLSRSLLTFAFSRSSRFSLSLSLSGVPCLQVRRACAPVLGIKSLLVESFR